MRRRLSSLLILTAASVNLSATVSVSVSGMWTPVPYYSWPVKKLIDARDEVLVLAGGGMFVYDKKNGETTSYLSSGRLSGVGIADMFYDSASETVIVAYENGGMGVGRDVYLPDLAEVADLEDRTINDAIIVGKNLYAATSFGLLCFDINRSEVRESGIYGKKISALASDGVNLFVLCDGGVYSAPLSSSIRNFDNFRLVAKAAGADKMIRFGNALILSGANTMMAIMPDGVTRNLGVSGTSVSVGKDGIYFVSSGSIKKIDTSMNVSVEANIPAEYERDIMACYEGMTSTWFASQEGITNVALSDGGGVTVLSERFLPSEMTVGRVSYLVPTADGSGVMASNSGVSIFCFDGLDESRMYQPQTSSVIDFSTGRVENVTAYPVTAVNSLARKAQLSVGDYPLGAMRPLIDPDDKGVYYLPTAHDGLYKVRNRTVEGRFDKSNSTIPEPWGCRVYGAGIDRGGNLWVMSEPSDSHSGIQILPADKRGLNPEQVSVSDWKTVEISSYNSGQDIGFLACQNTDMIYISDHSPYHILLACHTNGTPENTDDDTFYPITSLTDQDGKDVTVNQVYCMAEDRSGAVWIGTDAGVLSIRSADDLIYSGRVVRVKVPRGDGTGEADYLLPGEGVQSIAVDAANRKWLATQKSGLYLVSADGAEIVRHYTSENSELPSDNVFSVLLSPDGKDLYAGTGYGLYVLGVEGAVPATELGGIYAYPNPVRPEYMGRVQVKGLIDGAVVKVTDSAGRLVAQGQAEGGEYAWDVHDMSGRKAKSGVYYIVASDRKGTATATTKIMVIN